MPSKDLEPQAEMLVAKIKHYLITTMGRVSEEASSDEFYRALSFAMREEIMINWLANARTRVKEDVRTAYYLSMEYLPGRILTNTITNLCSNELVSLVLRKTNRNFNDIISREADPGLGNGGLGRLASCLLDSLATHHYPVQAYGLRYQYGIFEQQLWDGVQIEAPDCWLLNENPWEFRRDKRRELVKFGGETTSATNIHGDEILLLHNHEEVSVLPYDVPILGYSDSSDKFSVNTLRLWSAKESPTNFQIQCYNAGSLGQAAENTTLSDVLYPNDKHITGKRIRLKQEFLLVSASLQDIIQHYLNTHDNFRSFADKVRIQINDTHAALIIPELIRTLTKNYDLPWKTALEITQACTGYTNHTILKEALEEWDIPLLRYLLPRQLQIIQRINQDFCDFVRSKYPNDENKVQTISIIENNKARMANLAIFGSHRVNGVAQLHTEILKDSVFKDFNDLYPEKIINITNGVTPRRWLLECNPDLARFITKRIGSSWVTDFSHIQELAQFASDPVSQEELFAIKKKNKLRLINFLSNERTRNSRGEFTTALTNIDVDSIFDVHIKRIHEYKRQLLNLLNLIMIYQEILSNPQHQRAKRTAIFAGKAAAGYEAAKNIIHFIHSVGRKINRDPNVKGLLKIVFIENYNVSRAELIIPAADLSEQISTAGTEASGTGNMKLTMNGALTIGTDDGANIEMRRDITDRWWPFSFGCSAAEIAAMQQDNSYSPQKICAENPKIKRAVETLRDGTFATSDAENLVFNELYNQLMEVHYGEAPDRYFILKDLQSYYEVQKKVETTFVDPMVWSEIVIHNIAGMGNFTSDFAIKNYCDKVWNIKPCPVDEEILARVKHEYQLVDQCRIY